MENESAAEPLYAIIRRLRRPHSFRELMAACLRSIYMGDAFTGDKAAIPKTPKILLDEVVVSETLVSGVPCNIYAPKDSHAKLPAMLYMHGGGFVIGSADDTDYITRMLCHSNQIVVVSVNYRLAPEVIFPGALDDCEKVVLSLIAEPTAYGINGKHIFLAGDSAGGNLALALHQRLKTRKLSVNGLVLLAPWLDMPLEKYTSYNALAPSDIVMDAAFLAYCRASYIGFKDWKNPLVSPIHCNANDLPPTLIIVGDADPLIDQTIAFRSKEDHKEFKQIKVEIFARMPHCFYSFPNVFEQEESCYQRIKDFIGSCN